MEKRFAIIASLYLRHCGSHRIKLGKQIKVVKALNSIAEEICSSAEAGAKNETLVKKLQSLLRVRNLHDLQGAECMRD